MNDQDKIKELQKTMQELLDWAASVKGMEVTIDAKSDAYEIFRHAREAIKNASS